MAAYLLLAAAIVFEVVGTTALKLSDGFTRLWPSVTVVLGYGAAFGMLGYVLKLGVPMGVAYATWAAAGVALIALVGVVFFQEQFTATMVLGLLFVVGGVVLLELGGAH
ncbi:multidrug efflux SMR transporter [Haloechinothrix sp. YIM 98757]|uniref:Multidrug efflux SMR transporter n=1 Tax=Haloechinothrix aidingensis TaxID=2752311 RepID=A0A838AE88_9PSEU|nr:multidrug efflux SMR transporter [Haloechinothrix aidingensis]MBA0127616.1 multidrug efflux SMR transporter [Haloechinothrix aidingensis]